MGGPYSNSFGATSVDDDPLPNTPSSQTWLLKKIASLLQSVVANGTTGGGGGGTGIVQTPTWAAFTGDTAVAAGSKSITIVTNSSFVGTAGGASFPANASFTWNAQDGNTLGALAITCSAGGFSIGLT